MTTGKQLLFLELNEICFDNVAHYFDQGHLPHLREMVSEYGWSLTTSEQKYELLEPWIQWVTAHTGLAYQDHGVFRLGDIVSKDIPQIWEQLEERGIRVGAISPMNAKHRTRSAAFFVPDPWTRTDITAPPLLRQLYRAIAQAVNDNAENRIGVKSLFALMGGMARYARPALYPYHLQLGIGSVRKPWYRALMLDLLLAEVFEVETARSKPGFASLFLNAGAHIQHHYMFSSSAYRGSQSNPAWYAPPGADPLLDVYRLYDRIVGRLMRRFPQARIMIATGLRQLPYPKVTYYWRLKEHRQFLRLLGVDFERVEPRMSRDFLVVCGNCERARAAEALLSSVVVNSGQPLFEIDNRGDDLFVTFVFPDEIDRSTRFAIGSRSLGGLSEHVAFVALKNGEHDGHGYFIDTGERASSPSVQFPLAQIPDRIMSALGFGSSDFSGSGRTQLNPAVGEPTGWTRDAVSG